MSGPSLVERLRADAENVSRVSEMLADDKSRRNGHEPGAYMWQEPGRTLSAQAADRIAELEAEIIQANTDFASLQALFDKVVGERDRALNERDDAEERANSIEANGLSNCCREDGIEPCEPYKVLEAERDALRKALEPFANAADAYSDWASEHTVISKDIDGPLILIGHLRAARSLLSEGGGE